MFSFKVAIYACRIQTASFEMEVACAASVEAVERPGIYGTAHCDAQELESLRTCLLCLRGKAHCALCMWSSVQLLLSQQVLEARVVQCQSTGSLWASLSLFHYHFLTVSSCPFLEFKLHFRKLTLFFFSF